MKRAALSVLCALSMLACDGENTEPDTGPPAIEFVANFSTIVPSIGTLGPRPEHRFFVVNITLTANSEGPLSVAPIAFYVDLDTTMRIDAGPSETETIAEGCRSQTVALGASLSCNVVFELRDADTPVTITWSDGTRSRSAPVPAP